MQSGLKVTNFQKKCLGAIEELALRVSVRIDSLELIHKKPSLFYRVEETYFKGTMGPLTFCIYDDEAAWAFGHRQNLFGRNQYSSQDELISAFANQIGTILRTGVPPPGPTRGEFAVAVEGAISRILGFFRKPRK